MDEEAESGEATLAFEPAGQMVGDRDVFEGAPKEELAGLEIIASGGNFREGAVLLLGQTDPGREDNVVAALGDAELMAQSEVDGRALELITFWSRIEGDGLGGDFSSKGGLRKDHAPGG